MYRKILAAVNEHVNTEVAARYARYVAAAAGAKLVLCSIRQPHQSARSFELARETVKRLQHGTRELGVAAESLFDSGDPAQRLRAIVHNEGVDLVFAAIRRGETRRRFAASKHIGGRLLLLPCAVALVRVVHLGRTHPREVLIALKDRIDRIPERTQFTALLAKAFDAKVHLFHVTRQRLQFSRNEPHLTPLNHEGRVPPDITRFIDHLDGLHVEHERRMASGRTGISITIEAASRRRDLIVMGASGRGILGFLRGGDPVKEVLRETPCNVIVFKPGE